MSLLAVAVAGRGVVAPDEPVLLADDEGVLRGRSVFETLRVYGGVPFMLSAHLDRLATSAARLRLPEPPRLAFEEAAFDAIAAGGTLDASLRFLWTAGREGGAPTGLVLVSPLPPDLDALRERGLRLLVVHWAAGALAGAKSTSYAENMGAQALAAEQGCDDALLVAPDDTVLEAPTSNVWFREGEALLTPALSLPILAGVTRAAIRTLAPAAGYTVEEGVFSLDRLLAADEVFLSSSVREVVAVVSVDGREVARGPAAEELQDALRASAGYPDAG